MPLVEHELAGRRARLITTVRTPLGFFALVVLVAEALLGLAAAVLREDVDPVYMLAAMVALIFFLILIVSSFALFRPEALHGRRPDRIEPETADSNDGAEQVRAPHILCASTAGSNAQEFDRYAELVSRRFTDVTVRRDLSLDALRSALGEERYQVIHLVTQVAGADGTLRIGEQQLNAGGVRDLLDMSSVRLVVLSACDSLPFVSELARVANIITAPTTAVRSEVVEWSDRFYALLARGIAVSRAYSTAIGASQAPMLLMLTKDVAFSR
ncbi:MAG: CHAT domain-containing protein [Longimicrobiaceae bacterium]